MDSKRLRRRARYRHNAPGSRSEIRLFNDISKNLVFLATFSSPHPMGPNADNREGAKGAKEIQCSCTQCVASDRLIVWLSDSLFLRTLRAFAVNLPTWQHFGLRARPALRRTSEPASSNAKKF